MFPGPSFPPWTLCSISVPHPALSSFFPSLCPASNNSPVLVRCPPSLSASFSPALLVVSPNLLAQPSLPQLFIQFQSSPSLLPPGPTIPFLQFQSPYLASCSALPALSPSLLTPPVPVSTTASTLPFTLPASFQVPVFPLHLVSDYSFHRSSSHPVSIQIRQFSPSSCLGKASSRERVQGRQSPCSQFSYLDLAWPTAAQNWNCRENPTWFRAGAYPNAGRIFREFSC